MPVYPYPISPTSSFCASVFGKGAEKRFFQKNFPQSYQNTLVMTTSRAVACDSPLGAFHTLSL